MAKCKVKYSFTTEVFGNARIFLPGEIFDAKLLDLSFCEGMKKRGFIVPEKEDVVISKSIPGAVEFKPESFKNPEGVTTAKPPAEAPKKEEPKLEEVKEVTQSAGTPIIEQPLPKGRANRKN